MKKITTSVKMDVETHNFLKENGLNASQLIESAAFLACAKPLLEKKLRDKKEEIVGLQNILKELKRKMSCIKRNKEVYSFITLKLASGTPLGQIKKYLIHRFEVDVPINVIASIKYED